MSHDTTLHPIMVSWLLLSPLYSWFIYFGKSFYIYGWCHPCKDWMVLPPFSYVIWTLKCQLGVGDFLFHKDNQNVNWSDSLDLLSQKAKWKCQLEVCNYISLPSHGSPFCFLIALPYLHQILKRKGPFGYIG